MKRYLLLLFLLPLSGFAQVGQWVWTHGSNTPNGASSYGIKGVASPSNEPPAVYEGIEWTDLAGNFWLFGGLDQSYAQRGDLWKFDPVANEWTWVNGNNLTNDPGSYGIKGVGSSTNLPPARAWGAYSWVDGNGNLWMFGGYGSGFYDDLWMYNIASNQWAWMGGSNTPGATAVYGVLGVASPTNTPGGRAEGNAAWTDASNNLWLFGGYTSLGVYCDMWEFNTTTNQWAWMRGPQNTAQVGSYGIQGVEDPANYPPGREPYCKWKDNNGNFWLFGGQDYSHGNVLNDLWRFNPVTNNWTWMTGSNTGGAAGVYGTQCVSDAANTPGNRYENRACWVDASGNFWLFGGGQGGSFSDVWNDLWKYCPSANKWTWVSGSTTSNPAGSWGTKGVSSASNIPSGRGGAISWIAKNGSLYLFGGSTGPFLTPYNDLWAFTPDPNCGTCGALVLPPTANFTATKTGLCEGDCINFTNTSQNATSYQWTFTGGLPDTSTALNPQNICYYTAGQYNVTLVASNSAGTDTAVFTNYVSVHAAPPTPNITQIGNMLYCSTDPTYTSYQWYFNSSLINGATDTSYLATQSGNYNVAVTNENGCSISVAINIILGIQSLYNISDEELKVSPNPAGNDLFVQCNLLSGKDAKLEIYNMLGEKVYSMPVTTGNSKLQQDINVSGFAKGIYFVRLQNEHEQRVAKFTKQ